MNAAGDIAFVATISNLTGVTQGLFVRKANGEIRKVVAMGDPSPLGGTFSSVPACSFSFNDKAEIAFEGYTSPLHAAIYLATSAGLQEIVQSGDTTPLGGTYGSFTCTDWGLGIGRLNAGISLNNAGQVSFGSAIFDPSSPGQFLSSSPGAMFLWSAGTVSTVAYIGEPIPGGGVFDDLRGNQINDDGTVSLFVYRSQWQIWTWHGTLSEVYPTATESPLLCDYHMATHAAAQLMVLGVASNDYTRGGIISLGPGGQSLVADLGSNLPDGTTLDGCVYPLINSVEEIAFWGPGRTGIGASLFARVAGGSQLDLLDQNVGGWGQLDVSDSGEVVYSRGGGIWAVVPPVAHRSVDPTLSTVDLDKGSISANGADKATLTVTLRDENGNVITDPRPVTVLSDREIIDVISGPSTTGSDGTASFTITSHVAGYAEFSATADGVTINQHPQLTYVDYRVRKAVIFVQGYQSCLSRSPSGRPIECPISFLGLAGQESFTYFKSALKDVGFQDSANAEGIYSDFIEFSYQGGQMDPEGNWNAYSYGCEDPESASYSYRVSQLLYLAQEYHKYHPNAQLSVIGHSLGGVVAFQAVKQAEQAAGQPLPFAQVITIDSPINGVPSGPWLDWGRNIAAPFFGGHCTKQVYLGPATDSVRSLYGNGHKSAVIEDNKSVKSVAAGRGTYIWNVGNHNDCLWNPRRCPLNYQGWLALAGEASYPDTQYVEPTRNLKLTLPFSCVDPRACTKDEIGDTHTALLTGGINPLTIQTASALWKFAATCVIAPQVGAPSVPCSPQPR